MLEFEQIVRTVYWIILGLLAITIAARFLYFVKTREKRVLISEETSVFKYFRYATILTLPIFVYGFVAFVFVLQKGNMFAPNWMKNCLLTFLALFVITEIFYNFLMVQHKTNRILNIVFCAITGTIGVYLINLYQTAKIYPAKHESVTIELPIEGKWIASGAGATRLTNHHDRVTSQKYAVDLSKIGINGKLFTGEGLKKEESNTYGAEITSPVNGHVVWVVDTLPDSPIRERDKLAGNHIVIKFQDSLYVALAHLQPNSIPHSIGDKVVIGEYIGTAGMSGNTDFCHLHIHIQDRPEYDIEKGQAYPLRFKKFNRKRFGFWKTVENEFLLSNDIVEK